MNRTGVRLADLMDNFADFSNKFSILADNYMASFPGLKVQKKIETGKYSSRPIFDDKFRWTRLLRLRDTESWLRECDQWLWNLSRISTTGWQRAKGSWLREPTPPCWTLTLAPTLMSLPPTAALGASVLVLAFHQSELRMRPKIVIAV